MSPRPLPLHILLPLFLHPVLAQSRNNGNYWNNGIVIPTSTIVAIGVGFVAFGFSVLILLFVLRIAKVRRISRERGEEFRVVWSREGGFWGFLNSMGDTGGVGGGGIGGRRGIIRWDRNGEIAEVMKRPEMWEVSWRDEHELSRPLAVCSSTSPQKPERTIGSNDRDSPLPTIDIAIFISLPSPNASDSEALPNLIVGTTSLVPIIPSPLSRVVSEESDRSDGAVESKTKGQVTEVEYVSSPGGSSRRAKWEKSDTGQWHVEGIQ
ncbi:hypothetical protein IAR55_001444 [Kwoniella newhampshirensis]|uniref:Uncharacterized protein n=1 Tax=Kwoniella newhampshirensis TaxID=1651941 RepID=A0AAW0Z256_9TREE